MKLANRELATVLAALRHWEHVMFHREQSLKRGITPHYVPQSYDIATDGETVTPLSSGEINRLCERLNTVADGARISSQPVSR